MENIKAKIQGILLNCSQKSVIGWAVEESDFEHVAEEIVKNLALSGVVKSLKSKETISFEDWKKRHIIDEHIFNHTYLHETEGWVKEKNLIKMYESEQTL